MASIGTSFADANATRWDDVFPDEHGDVDENRQTESSTSNRSQMADLLPLQPDPRYSSEHRSVSLQDNPTLKPADVPCCAKNSLSTCPVPLQKLAELISDTGGEERALQCLNRFESRGYFWSPSTVYDPSLLEMCNYFRVVAPLQWPWFGPTDEDCEFVMNTFVNALLLSLRVNRQQMPQDWIEKSMSIEGCEVIIFDCINFMKRCRMMIFSNRWHWLYVKYDYTMVEGQQQRQALTSPLSESLLKDVKERYVLNSNPRKRKSVAVCRPTIVQGEESAIPNLSLQLVEGYVCENMMCDCRMCKKRTKHSCERATSSSPPVLDEGITDPQPSTSVSTDLHPLVLDEVFPSTSEVISLLSPPTNLPESVLSAEVSGTQEQGELDEQFECGQRLYESGEISDSDEDVNESVSRARAETLASGLDHLRLLLQALTDRRNESDNE